MARLPRPPAPFVAPVSGDIEQRLAQITDMVNAMQDTNTSPTYPWVGLTDELGQTWRLYMQSNGQLRSELVTRT